MKQISVIGKTDAIINLNKIGVPIRGKSKAILTITTVEQEAELMGVVRAGFLDIIPMTPVAPSVKAPESNDAHNDKTKKDRPEKKKGGRPKGAKNKPKDTPKNTLAEEEGKRITEAEALTQKMGSRAIIGTLDGPKVGRMTRSAAEDITQSEQTRASIEAMEKLEKEEQGNINSTDALIDESKLDASDKIGGKAVIATESGTSQVNMANSILPESKKIRQADPFIDRESKAKPEVPPAPKPEVKSMEDDDGLDASFIEI